MLNTDRIRLMTQLAIYEQGEGKEYMPMTQYYRRDYVGLQMIKTFICSTLAFGILFLLSVLYRLEQWMQELYQMDYVEYAFGILMQYIVFTVFYQVVAWVIYTLRHKKAQRKQKIYYNRLKKVEKLHEREEKLLPIDEWDA